MKMVFVSLILLLTLVWQNQQSVLFSKQTIKGANVARGVTVLTKQRSQTVDEVEKLLLIWINEKMLAGDSVSEGIICEIVR
jgi:hypothetical protein